MVDGRGANIIGKERLCPMCAGEMRLARCEDRSDLFKWKCRRQEKGKSHKAEISIRKGSWFEKSKITLEEILKLTYWWCQDLDQAHIKQEPGLANRTGVDWDRFCLHYSTGTHKTTMFIYGRVGQPRPRAVYLTYMQICTNIKYYL